MQPYYDPLQYIYICRPHPALIYQEVIMSLITEEQPPGLLYLPTSPHSHSTSTREYERPVVTMTTTSPSQGQACNPKTSTVTGTICIVCNEVATKDTSFRKHYGVVCCEACKCFFRRTVQMSRDYKCRYDGKCMIGRYHDNMKQVCQACRFSQCIRAGMKIDCKSLTHTHVHTHTHTHSYRYTHTYYLLWTSSVCK